MKKIICIIILLMLAVGCGPALVYPHLDWLIPWYVDDYISLNSDQSSMLKSRLVQQLDWHCRTQLSIYADSLRALSADFENTNPPLTYAILNSDYIRLLEIWKSLMRQITPDVSEILITATDQQIDELFSNLNKKNQDLKSEYVDSPPDELLKNRRKRMIERLEYWISSPTTEQKQAVTDWNHRLQPISEEWLHNRERFQADIRRLLTQRSDVAYFREKFSEMLIYPERGRSPGYQQKIEHNTAVTLNFLVTINRLLTPDQRKKLLRRLNDLAEDFDRLSCEPEAKS
jgi:hypothetical protein